MNPLSTLFQLPLDNDPFKYPFLFSFVHNERRKSLPLDNDPFKHTPFLPFKHLFCFVCYLDRWISLLPPWFYPSWEWPTRRKLLPLDDDPLSTHPLILLSTCSHFPFSFLCCRLRRWISLLPPWISPSWEWPTRRKSLSLENDLFKHTPSSPSWQWPLKHPSSALDRQLWPFKYILLGLAHIRVSAHENIFF